LQEQTV